MNQVEVGKFTLESLTTGMYSEPEIVFREYIQNSVDSIDEAIAQGILLWENSRIDLIVDDLNRSIFIKDNGTGIAQEKAAKVLLDIGNSKKLHSQNRGFRGIGRLGGLSYCKKLSFITSYYNEPVKTIVAFDCEKLKQLLIPGQSDQLNLQQVISAITTISTEPEDKIVHYFEVKMEGIDDISNLLDYDYAKDYISQVAPLTYPKEFYRSSLIYEKASTLGFPITEYPIYLGKNFGSVKQLFKPNRNRFKAGRKDTEKIDEIQHLEFFEIRNGEELIAWGWYGVADWSGSIVDDRISGIRIRKGNILIGNSLTLNKVFKEGRFNGWTQGELFVLSNELIPNARRDDFEQNEKYKILVDSLAASIGTDITNRIREASRLRNNPAAKTLSEAETTLESTKCLLEEGFNSTFEKKKTIEAVEANIAAIKAIPKKLSEGIESRKTELIESLATIVEEVSDSRNYKANSEVPSDFSKKEKKVVQAILEVLSRYFEKEMVDELRRELIIELTKDGK